MSGRVRSSSCTPPLQILARSMHLPNCYGKPRAELTTARAVLLHVLARANLDRLKQQRDAAPRGGGSERAKVFRIRVCKTWII